MTTANVARAVRLVMTLLVRNEEDVLRANLDYHFARGVSFVIATDNLSTDGSTDILREYEREGRLKLLLEHGDDYDQPRWVTRMAKMAKREFDADWVINNDADEFWWPDQGTIVDVLASVPRRYGAVTAPRANFLPITRDDGPFYERLVYRLPVGVREGDGQVLLPKTCHRGRRRVFVPRGAHRVSGPFLRPMPTAAPITVLHFPMRSWPQFEAKIASGGAALARSTQARKSAGAVLRKGYEDYQAGRLRARWDELLASPEALAQGLADASIVEDRRLAEFFSGHPG